MVMDIVRAIIQKVMRDKILLGLVIIGVLAVFMTGANGGREKPQAPDEEPISQEAMAAHKQAQGQEGQNGAGLEQQNEAQGQQPDPTLATEFVKWWIGGAMDYGATTARENHEAAFKWMDPEAQAAFQAAFWTPEIASGVESGTLVAGFQPVSVQPEAINPDGSIVVGVTGSLVMQANGQTSTRGVDTHFLVKREERGMRIAGLYNSTVSQVAAQQGSYY